MAKNYLMPNMGKSLIALMMLVPVLMFGKTDDLITDKNSTATSAPSANGEVVLPDAPSCDGANGTYSWQNNLVVTNTGWVNADIRFVQGNGALIYEIPGPYPEDFSQGIRVDIDEAISWDGYPNRDQTNPQLFERWKLVFLKDNVIQFISDYTQDLEDGVNSAQWKGPLNQDIVFPNGIDRICIVHYEDPTLGTGYEPSANSVVPSSICLSYEPICDLEVDAGDDVEVCSEENVELTATYSGSIDCVTGCEYPVLDMLKCHGGDVDSEEVYLFSDGGSVVDRKFNATSQNFETFSDGTARYTATATNGIDVIEVNMLYSGRTSTAPVNSPKEHSCGYNQDVAGFEYYPTLNGTIVSQNHGTFYATSMGPSFQIGDGADVTRNGFGASGWFNLTGGDGHYSKGDVNIPLGTCVEEEVDEVSFVWTTQDGTIVGANDQPTIEVSSSGTYEVTVTNCNGCTASDTVVVNMVEKVTIGDFVWDDANRNGTQDNDEVGVDGVNVSLYTCDETFVESIETENGGFYSFDVCPGDYYVVFSDVPEGYGFTNANIGDDALDSDAGANGSTPCFTVNEVDDYTFDAGLYKTCALEPAIEGDDLICEGEEIEITASGGDTYLWSTGDTSASISVMPQATTTYTVIISDSMTPDCEETLDFTVEVSSIDIDAGPDVVIIFSESTTLTVTGTAPTDDILWSTGQTTPSITVSPESTTTYYVTVTNDLLCIAEDSVVVTVNNPCNINPSFKVLPRDTPGVYIPGDETAACIGDDYYIWMYIDGNKLGDSYAEDFTDWKFTFEFPNGDVIVQENEPQYPGNNRAQKLNLTAEDFGEYKISWISPEGCEGSTVMTLNFPDVGCGVNGTRSSQSNKVASVYPLPAKSGSNITLEVNTISKSINTTSKDDSIQKNELLSIKETVWVSIYNIGGQQLGQSVSYEVEKGMVKIDYNLNNLPSGNYILKVDGNGWTDSKQIIIE